MAAGMLAPPHCDLGLCFIVFQASQYVSYFTVLKKCPSVKRGLCHMPLKGQL